jgi:hypothetical protein
MSRIDTLPVDQGAVLQLLLRRRRPYHEIAGLLDIDEAEVRRRAHGALDTLGPDETPGLDPAQKADVADYLLGQQDEGKRAATHAFLELSAAGRAWARVVAGELRGVAGDGLPEIPAEGRDDAAVARPASAPPAAAQPASAPAAAAQPTSAPPAAEAAAVPLGAAASAGDPAADTTATDAFGAGPDAGRAGAPRVSRLGGALLLGGLAVVAVAVVLFLVLRDGGDEPSSTPAASTTATQPQAQVEAQANLVPPNNRKSLKALGVVLVQKAQGQEQIVAAVQGLPKPKRGGYGIWLYSGPGKAQWLGFFASQDQQGRLLARGQLKTPIAGYREILVTREAKGNPARPGSVFLRGPIQTASNNSAGG